MVGLLGFSVSAHRVRHYGKEKANKKKTPLNPHHSDRMGKWGTLKRTLYDKTNTTVALT
jgi:hypothetical protein